MELAFRYPSIMFRSRNFQYFAVIKSNVVKRKLVLDKNQRRGEGRKEGGKEGRKEFFLNVFLTNKI